MPKKIKLKDTETPDDTPVEYRDWMDTKKFQSNDSGAIIRSQRLFGVEIECCEPSIRIRNIVANAMGKDLGMGMDAGGVEWKTPKLKGKVGEEYILKLCGLLEQYKFGITGNCGMHIHLDGGRDFREETSTKNFSIRTLHLTQLFAFYIAFEDVIQSFVAPSRRRKSWCNPLKEQFSTNMLLRCQTQFEIEKLWYNTNSAIDIQYRKKGRHNGQRPGINFTEFFSFNHIEIRYHGGTINARKILEWVNLHQTIADHASTGSFGGNFGPIMRAASLEEKTELFFRYLHLPQSSMEYFLARQELFKIKTSLAFQESIKAIITNDSEILV